MEVFVARQPIFNEKEETVAYELLYRKNDKDNKFNSIDEDDATLNVITNSFFTIGIDKVVEGKLAFINFSEELLKSDIIHMLPSKNIVVEILETVEPSDEIIKSCKELKRRGYLLALDDFVFHKKYAPLIELADIIKIDFLITKGLNRKVIIDNLKRENLKFLAEKVETYEDFEDAIRYGYSFFQGYYFSKPVILSAKDVPITKLSYVSIINEINRREPNLEELEKIIIKDISLSYKLLKLINSSAFYLKTEVESVKQAVAFLGEKEIRKWLYVIIIQGIGEDKSPELVRNSLIRAKFSELTAIKLGKKEKAFEAYMMGMISMLDCFLNRPLEELLEELFISEEVKNALIKDGENWLSYIYRLISCYERAEWKNVVFFCEKLKIDKADILDIYVEAVSWTGEAINKG